LGAEWWLRLTRDWLAAEGLAAELAPELAEASRRLGFSEGSILFRLYADVVPCLDRLKSLGIRTAVLSNWDYSLHQALAIFDLNARFECVLASLEEGCEKPQAEFFGLLVSRLGVEPFEVLHVGDDPVADVWGAREAGLRAVLIDRNATDVLAPDVISTLDRLEETRAWNG
jgi:putative hydrolase of the HAD superfamily